MRGPTRTRTYLIPEASLPARFGLSETYGVFPSAKAAARFLDRACARRSPAARTGTWPPRSPTPRRQRTSTLDLSTWDLRTEVAKDRSVRFRLGFVRVGRTVAQLTFAPSPADDMTATSFHALLVRAGDRLRELG